VATDKEHDGEEEEEAKFRLRDILVEEVSYVDRAANRRRFLVVKNAKKTLGGQTMDENTQTPVAETKQGPIPTPVKEGLLRVLTEVLERGVSLTNMIKEAEETQEQMAEPVPAEIGAEMKALCDLLSGALGRYPSPVSAEPSETAMAKGAGVRFADLAKQLGAMALEIKSEGTITKDESAKVLSFLSDYQGALHAVGAAAAPEAQPSEVATPAPPAEDDVEKRKLSGGRLVRYKDAIKSLEDAFARFMKILEEVEPAAPPPAEKRLEESTPQTPDPKPAAELGNIGSGGSPDDGKAGKKMQEDVPELAELMKRLDTMTARVAELSSTPVPQGSRPEADPPGKPAGGGTNERNRRGMRQGGPWVW
jgi:hypothetical protein